MRMRNCGHESRDSSWPPRSFRRWPRTRNTWATNKGFFFHTPKFELKISTRTQFRYTYTMTDQNSLTDDNGYFNLPRTRLRSTDTPITTWLKYKVQYDFTGQDDAGASPGRKSPDLRDLYSTWRATRARRSGSGSSRPRSASRAEPRRASRSFVDRSIASEKFAPSRQEGAMPLGYIVCEEFGYESGAFNGNGRNTMPTTTRLHVRRPRPTSTRTASTSSRSQRSTTRTSRTGRLARPTC